jgi:hypothetical protein
MSFHNATYDATQPLENCEFKHLNNQIGVTVSELLKEHAGVGGPAVEITTENATISTITTADWVRVENWPQAAASNLEAAVNKLDVLIKELTRHRDRLRKEQEKLHSDHDLGYLPPRISTRLTLPELIAVFGSRDQKKTDYGTTIHSGHLFAGTSDRAVSILRKLLPSSFYLISGWSNRDFRGIWLSDELKAEFTYAEGDTSIEVAKTAEQYTALVQSSHEFYTIQERTGHSIITNKLPLAQAAIALLSDDWRRFKLLRCEELITSSLDIKELWERAELELKTNPAMLGIEDPTGCRVNFDAQSIETAKAEDSWILQTFPKPLDLA